MEDRRRRSRFDARLHWGPIELSELEVELEVVEEAEELEDELEAVEVAVSELNWFKLELESLEEVAKDEGETAACLWKWAPPPLVALLVAIKL